MIDQNTLSGSRKRTYLALATIGIASFCFVAAGTAQPFPANSYQPSQAAFQSDRAAKPGWQTPQTFDIEAGETGQQIGKECPKKYPVALNGAFAFNSVGQTDNFTVSFNAPRYDETNPDYRSWGWHFWWAAGAASGESVAVNVYCVAAP